MSIKKLLGSLCLILVSLFGLNSCAPEEGFEESLLIGKWCSGTLYYRYDHNGSGKTWDVSEDVIEEEAQAFTWTLVKAELTHIHVLETRSSGVPKVYTITKLTENELLYKDDYGKAWAFTKK